MTAEIAQKAVGKAFNPNESGENLIDSYIERSRKTIHERARAKATEAEYENQRVEKMMSKPKIIKRQYFGAESITVIHVPAFEFSIP